MRKGVQERARAREDGERASKCKQACEQGGGERVRERETERERQREAAGADNEIIWLYMILLKYHEV